MCGGRSFRYISSVLSCKTSTCTFHALLSLLWHHPILGLEGVWLEGIQHILEDSQPPVHTSSLVFHSRPITSGQQAACLYATTQPFLCLLLELKSRRKDCTKIPGSLCLYPGGDLWPLEGDSNYHYIPLFALFCSGAGFYLHSVALSNFSKVGERASSPDGVSQPLLLCLRPSGGALLLRTLMGSYTTTHLFSGKNRGVLCCRTGGGNNIAGGALVVCAFLTELPNSGSCRAIRKQAAGWGSTFALHRAFRLPGAERWRPCIAAGT